MNECELCGLLLLRKERMFWSVIIKIFICRKKIKNLLTFENSKIVLKDGFRLQPELIKVQVAFFMQFAQKGGKGYEYDII